MTLELEVTERHIFRVTDPELAEDVRQALQADDIERLAELIEFLESDGPSETAVLTVGEVKR